MASFAGADCRCSRFENAVLKSADFSACRLDRAEFNNGNCEGARFIYAKMPFSVFSHAVVRNADFSGADLTQSVLHRIDDKGANWKGAVKTLADPTDKDLAEAEDWRPPTRQQVK